MGLNIEPEKRGDRVMIPLIPLATLVKAVWKSITHWRFNRKWRKKKRGRLP